MITLNLKMFESVLSWALYPLAAPSRSVFLRNPVEFWEKRQRWTVLMEIKKIMNKNQPNNSNKT